ncbi:MAG: ABC transporter permease, partial [Verrucomicrobiota bacterium]
MEPCGRPHKRSRIRMNLFGCLWVGWRYLQRNRWKTVILVSAISLSISLPLAIFAIVDQAEKDIRARSISTPLLLGAPGSPLELAFHGLYFKNPEVPSFAFRFARDQRELAREIPIHAKFSARGFRIVGTTIDYVSFRSLTLSQGRPFALLGECVLGSEVARTLALAPGDSIVSTPEQLFDLAGVYPLKMKITGVLAPTGTADDAAIFTDLKTTWVIEGIAHGHEDAEGADEATILTEEDTHRELNASVVEYTEITAENVSSFHFHGNLDELPVTAAILLPHDQRAETLLLGRFPQGSVAGQL